MKDGFTFLEIMVTLVILMVAVSILLMSQGLVLRLDRETRLLELSRLEAERIATETWLGVEPAVIMETSSWDLDLELVNSGGLTNPVLWQAWRIAPSNEPAPSTVIELRNRGN